MPVIEGQAFAQVAIVFGVIGLVGLILRWAFRRSPGSPAWPLHRPDPSKAHPAAGSALTPPTAGQAHSPSPAPGAVTGRPMPTAEATAAREDYGLLTVIADLGTAEEAARGRDRLVSLGIRATTAVTSDGRHRILVFHNEAMRGRRALGGN